MSTTTISVSRVGKTFGKRTVLADVSLSVPAGHIFGLLGPSGSGKTTLVKLIAGVESPSTGTVHVYGEPMPSLRLMERIGYMAQSDALYAELTALENLQFFASLYGLSGKQQKQRIERTMELVGLASELHKPVNRYSGGMKRRLSLAIALLHEPGILILDEPTVGIDPVLRKQIWEELGRLSKQDGTTLLVTTHVMDEAERCDTLGMIREGKLIGAGSPEQLKRESGAASIEDAFLSLSLPQGGVIR